MVINHKTKDRVEIGDLKPGECFKVTDDALNVFIMTDKAADGNLTGKKAVNLLTGALVEYNYSYVVIKVETEVTVYE